MADDGPPALVMDIYGGTAGLPRVTERFQEVIVDNLACGFVLHSWSVVRDQERIIAVFMKKGTE